MRPYFNAIILSSLLSVFLSCETFLDEKPDRKLVVPTTLDDLQAMLDAFDLINGADPGEGEAAADDYYLTDDAYAGLYMEEDRRAYTWQPDHATAFTYWWSTYRSINYANIILETLPGIALTPQDRHRWNDIKGQALFLRGKSYLTLMNVWAPAYDAGTSHADLGVPLRLKPDFNERSVRATVDEVFQQIIADLSQSADLLPASAMHALRASRPAATAMLARTYLFMRNYVECLRYADESLASNATLVDYNHYSSSVPYPFADFSGEILYASWMAYYPAMALSYICVDSLLHGMYSEGDLRKDLYFQDNGNGTYGFKGGYGVGYSPFTGIANDEVYLMKAECLARAGDGERAAEALLALLERRYVTGYPFHISWGRPADLLEQILVERRKELLFRGLRFPDVKRLNKESGNISFKRKLGGSLYELPPNDPRFALSIPEEVLERAPGIVQNPR